MDEEEVGEIAFAVLLKFDKEEEIGSKVCVLTRGEAEGEIVNKSETDEE